MKEKKEKARKREQLYKKRMNEKDYIKNTGKKE